MRKFQIVALMVAALSTLTFFSRADGQTTANLSLMQLAKLTSSNGTAGSQFGKQVAFSGDTAVVGTYVFVKGANGWGDMTESATLAPSDGTAFLGPAAISGDTIAVGSPGDNGFVFTVYVFVKPSTGWSGTVTETAILTAPNINYLGDSVAINGDTILSGGFQAGGLSSVFVKPSTGWKSTTQPNATLVTPFVTGPNPIAISGKTIAIGASTNFGEGTVYVYVEPSTGWSGTLNPTASLFASDAKFGDALGSSVAISGTVLVAGAPGVNQFAGAAYVFVEPLGGWTSATQTAKLSAPGTLNFGFSMSVSGNAITPGAPSTTVGFNQGQGAAYVYLKPTNGWKNTSKANVELTASDGAAGDNLGASASISGSTIIAGAPLATIGSNQSQGAVYVFGK